jgi:uncharacterized membrane protein YeiH
MIIHYLSLIGVSVFAMSGALAAGKKKLDWIGVGVLASITALGGGTVRDVLLNRDAIFWIEEPVNIWVCLLTAVCTILYVRFFSPPQKALLVADALGLALFTIVGAQVAEDAQMSLPIVAIMGIITGVVGGVLRDILASEVPLIFRPTSTLYSVAALIGVLVYLAAQALNLNQLMASLIGIGSIASIRFIAIFWNITLPAFHISND